MGLFSSLFGGSRKQDFGSLIPAPPQFQLAQGSQGQYLGGIQDLIDVFSRRSQGQDQFDALQYIYGPQATELRQNYGIDTDPRDIYSQRTGALPKTLASLNQRGLLDTGVSGIIEGQLRSNLANELARAYGGAKTMQRQDIDAAYSNLSQLFPQRFQAQNIQNQIDYENALNKYNVDLQRNAATANQQQSMAANKASAIQSGLGLGLSALMGGMGGAGLFGSGSAIGSGGFGGFTAGALGGATGSYNPYQQMSLKNIFGNNNSGSIAPSNQGSPLLRNYSNYYNRPFNSSNSNLFGAY